MARKLSYLGVELKRPRAAFFDFTGCEGCQLQILNEEDCLLDFLSLVEVVNFREAMTEASDDYDIAFVEGCVTRDDEIVRLRKIRSNAKILVAFGTCACFGGVNQLKNRFAEEQVKKAVYGHNPIDTRRAEPLSRHANVDMSIPGCPVNKKEVEEIVLNLVLGKSVRLPCYPVCMECKANGVVCLYDMGEPCLGPVTRAGCGAWCTKAGTGCWGCRGPSEDCNLELVISMAKEKGIPEEAMMDRIECFGGFAEKLGELRGKTAPKAGGTG